MADMRMCGDVMFCLALVMNQIEGKNRFILARMF